MTIEVSLPTVVTLVEDLGQALPDFGRVAWVAQTDSTNTQLLAEARDPKALQPRPALLGAHHQTQGKGRAGRQWHNLEHTTLMFSCAFDAQLPPAQLPMLAPICGVMLCEQLRAVMAPAQQHRLTLKWPNDILFDGLKLVGLLVEVVRPAQERRSHDHHVVVMGMGMNLSQAQALSEVLQRPVTDWTTVVQAQAAPYRAQAQEVSGLVARVARAWHQGVADYERHGFAPFVARYAAVDGLKGQQVEVRDGERLLFSGVAQGVNAQACLDVLTDEGLRQVIYGDVSIRPRAFD